MSCEHDGVGVSAQTFHKILNERKGYKLELEERASKVTGKINRAEYIMQNFMRGNKAMKNVIGKKNRKNPNPIPIFSNKIWDLILNMLLPEDRRGSLKRHQRLLRGIQDDEILKVLKIEKDPNLSLGIKEERPNLPLTHHLELRGVSKLLRTKIDLYIENALIRKMRTLDFDFFSSKPRKTVHLDLTGDNIHHDMDKLDRVLATTEQISSLQLHDARFIARSLTVTVTNTNNFTELFYSTDFREKMTFILSRAGDQIWHFTFNLNLIYGLGEVYTALMEWLSFMPNLKWLQLFHFGNGSSSSGSFDAPASPRQHKICENLERVDFLLFGLDNFKSRVETICQEILKENSRIRFLNLFGKGFDIKNVIPSGGLPHLESITIRDGKFLDITKSMNPAWQLTRMTLSFDMENESLVPLFQFIRSYFSLEHLSLTIKNVTVGAGLDFLELPDLQTLELDITTANIAFSDPIHFFFSLQFLLYTKKLRSLTWKHDHTKAEEITKLKCYMERSKEHGNMIDFGGGWGDLTNSNIWDVFPNLEYVTVNLKHLVSPNGKSSHDRVYHNGKLATKPMPVDVAVASPPPRPRPRPLSREEECSRLMNLIAYTMSNFPMPNRKNQDNIYQSPLAKNA